MAKNHMLTRNVLHILSLVVLCVTTVLVPSTATASNIGQNSSDLRQTDEPLVDTPKKGPIAIGSRDFTEQLVLGQLMVVALEEAGFEVIDKTGLGGNNSAHNAIESAEVDIIWDYIGTILSESHGVPPVGLPSDLDAAFQMVSALDARHHDLLWLTPTPFNDTYTLMIEPTALAEKTGQVLTSIDDLADYMVDNDSSLSICVENEFYSRNDGLFSMQDHYGFAFNESNIEIVAYDQLYEGLRDGICDIAEGFSTDGRISAWGLQNLDDSAGFFPAYNASPIIREDVISEYPEIIDILNQISALLDNRTIAELNARVDLGEDGEQASGDEADVRDVAVAFLQEQGIIAKEEVSKPGVTVGSRDFTEQLILGQIIVVLLEDAGYEVTDSTGLGGTNSAHDALKAGEVDIIWDYIGTILSESHGIPPIGLPADTETALEMVRGLDAHHHDLVWLEPTAFNDTYTMMIKPDALEKKVGTSLGSIDDLADYMNSNDAPLSFCVENEFYARGDGLFSLQDHYGFAFAEENIEIVAYDQLYEGLRDGLCDVAEGFSTDGRISSWGFQNLADTGLFFPAYNASPIVRRELLADYPEISDLLNKLGPYLDNDTIASLNARVDIGPDGLRNSGDEENVKDVAETFLRQNKLLTPPEIAVGSRDFTEQLVLGQILIETLEAIGFKAVDKTGLGGTNSAHDALKAGEVDIIWDYIGTILSESHGVPPIGLPSDTETGLRMVQGLDSHHHNLTWLKPTAFNDTYTLMIKPEALEAKIGQPLASMDALAEYMNENDSPLTLCVENEFYARGDGLYSLQEHYGFTFSEENIQIVAYDQLYEGLKNDTCDVAEGFSTDGRISAWGFQNLADSQQFFPAYNASPIIHNQLIEQYPEIGEVLEQIADILDNDTIAELNARVDIGADGERSSGDEEDVGDVARSFLAEAIPSIAPVAEEAQSIDQDAATDDDDGENTNASTSATTDTNSDSTGSASTDTDSTDTTSTDDEGSAESADSDISSADENSTEEDTAVQLNEDTVREDAAAANAVQAEEDSSGNTETLDSEAVDTTSESSADENSINAEKKESSAPSDENNSNADDGKEEDSNTDTSDSAVSGQTEGSSQSQLTGALATEQSFLDERFLKQELIVASTDEPIQILLGHMVAALLQDLGIPVVEEMGLGSSAELRSALDNQEVDIYTDLSLDALTLVHQLPESVLPTDMSELFELINSLDQTDGIVWFTPLVVGEEFPSATVTRLEILEAAPGLAGYMGILSSVVTKEVMDSLIDQVGVGPDGVANSGDEVTNAEAAHRFLCEQTIITDCEEASASRSSPARDELLSQVQIILLPTATSQQALMSISNSTSVPNATSTPFQTATPLAAIAVTPAGTPAGTPTRSPLQPLTLTTPTSASLQRNQTGNKAEPTIVVPAAHRVNARATTSIDAPIIEVLERNQTYTVSGRTADSLWIQVQIDEKTAWAFTEAVLYSADMLQSLPIVIPPSLTSVQN